MESCSPKTPHQWFVQHSVLFRNRGKLYLTRMEIQPLWTNITISIPGRIEQMRGCVEYCHECIPYSCMLQLEMALDYTSTERESTRRLFLSFDDRVTALGTSSDSSQLQTCPFTYGYTLIMPPWLSRETHASLALIYNRWKGGYCTVSRLHTHSVHGP
jgi:hypothetical protein